MLILLIILLILFAGGGGYYGYGTLGRGRRGRHFARHDSRDYTDRVFTGRPSLLTPAMFGHGR